MSHPLDADITQFQTDYAAFIAVARQYPADQHTTGGVVGRWSAWDVIAHLSGWLVEAQRRYQRYPRGTGDMQYEVDHFNDVSIWLRQGQDYETLIAELQTLVAELSEMARAIPPEQVEREQRYREWLNVMAEDARRHTDDLQAFLAAQSA